MQRRHTTSSNPHPSAKESDRLPTFTKNEKNSFNAYSSRQSNKQRKMSKNVIFLIFSLAFLCFLFAPPDKNNNNNNEKVTFHHEVNNAVENLEGLKKTTPLNKSSTLNRLHQIKQKRTSEEASAAMKAQSSTFVDGEKLLKKELLKLQEHQKNGKYLGVKHLTNWEGPDVPIWDEGEDSGEEEEQDRGQNNSHEEVAESEHEDNHNNIINSVGTKEEEGEKKPQSIDIQSKIDPASMFARDMDKNSDGMHQQITALEGDKDISNEGEEEVNLDKNLKPVPLHDQIVKESQKEKDEIEGDLLNLDEAEDLSAEVESFSSPMSIFDVSPPASIYVTPSYGAHRPNVDAVFALADGYDLNIYILFIHTLRSTGFDGDIVLQVSHMKEGVEEYLRSQTNLILYDTKWECRSRRDPSVVSEKANEGMNLCLANNLYQSSEPLKDPRDARPVATIRYELYWIWSTMYNDDSMLMLIDFRDAYFQLNPFESIERTPKDEIDDGGLLFLFGVSLQQSPLSVSILLYIVLTYTIFCFQFCSCN